MTLRAGREFGDFVIQGLIGSGGMGSVYRARDTRHDRTVALKVLAEDVSDADPGARARFAREAKAIGDIAHPAIARVHHSGLDEGISWISMQYVEGSNLGELLAEKGPGPLAAVVRTLGPIAEALDELHGVGRDDPRVSVTLHRDIKPANIIVSPKGVPGPAATLVDFGIARRADGVDKLTATTSVTGTQGYLAPEAVTAHGDLRGPAADQYSLAVVAYRTLTGRLPFPDAVLTPDVHRRYHDELVPPSRMVQRLPPAVDGVLARALSTDPDSRFPSCRAFTEALDEVERGRGAPVRGPDEPTRALTEPMRAPAEAPSSAATASPAPRRRRGLALGAAFVTIVLVGGAALVATRVLPALIAEPLPAQARAAFPGLVPADDATPGVQGADCTAGESTNGVVEAVTCASTAVGYQVYVFTSPEHRDAMAGSDGRPSVVLAADENCAVRVVDSGQAAPEDHRTVLVVPEDSRRSALAVVTVPADSFDAAQDWATSAPLCGT